jgi:hypothetical protein
VPTFSVPLLKQQDLVRLGAPYCESQAKFPQLGFVEIVERGPSTFSDSRLILELCDADQPLLVRNASGRATCHPDVDNILGGSG